MANSPTRIGLDLRFWRSSTGGVGRYQRNLLTELLQLDRTTQFTAIITPEDEAEFRLKAPNLESITIDAPHFSFDEQTKLLSLLNKEKFDLVHFGNFNHPLLYRGRFVVTVHDLIMHFFPMGRSQKSLIRRAAYRKVMNDCQRAAKIIVPSQSTKTDLVEQLRFPAEKIVITPEGSESRFRVASAAEIEKVKNKFHLPDQYLLFVSRWERYKGLPELLTAYQTLHKRFPELGLVICGRPDAQSPDVAAAVKATQAANPRVITPGFVSDDDLTALYSGATVYVHPSWYEGFGIMILEAFGAGAPVVTTNVSSLPEVVGDAGLLAEPKNPQDLAAKIEQILTDPALAKDLVKKGHQQVQKFSWTKMAKKTLSIYQEVLGE